MNKLQFVDSRLVGYGNLVQISDETGIKEIITVEVSPEVYNDALTDQDKYIYQDEEVKLNPNYEEEKRQQRRAELDRLTLTPSDVERALYYSKLKMDFDDLKAFIHEKLPELDIKGLSIEFRAKDFYRGATAAGMRLFDVIGALIGYTSDDMDYLFQHKELPEKE